MFSFRDIMDLDVMNGMKLIAGEKGLDNEIEKVSILDYEFTRKGSSYASWSDGEFVLTTFLYVAGDASLILPAVKRLCRIKAAGLAIRNVFQLEISKEVIWFANQHNFPIFIIDDHQCYFEKIIIGINDLKQRLHESNFQERSVVEILNNHFSQMEVKERVLKINPSMGNSYEVYFLKPVNFLGENNLNNLIKGKKKWGSDNLIRYKEGAFYICTIDQSKNERTGRRESWYRNLSLEPERFIVGVSEIHRFQGEFREALLESYFACFYAQTYHREICSYDCLGWYQILFQVRSAVQMERYMDKIYQPIIEYDRKMNTDLWPTLMVYESSNGDLKKTSERVNAHINTIRYRLKKICEFFGKEFGDRNFELELFSAVKIFYALPFIRGNLELFD